MKTKSLQNIKKIITLVTILLFFNLIITSSLNNLYTAPKSNNFGYARIKSNNSHLYKTTLINESLENKWCLLPETFFVKILDDYNDTYYKVQFKNLVGYVKKDNVNLVNETPVKPYPHDTTFSIKKSTGAHLRATPKKDNSLTNTIATISKGTENITYVAKIFGEEGVDTQGTIWYLVNYNQSYGYIHSYYADSYIQEQINTEHTTLKLSIKSSNLNPLTNYQNTFLIGLTLIPLIFILVLLYKPAKVKLAKSTTSKLPNKTTLEINDFTEPEL